LRAHEEEEKKKIVYTARKNEATTAKHGCNLFRKFHERDGIHRVLNN